ncbi:MAG TPA: substrate-binding domain-containing protein [Candidatus Saccharimonadales bacterium]|nr:substrate-binding domain-containing protein [Candidatus Saccharimonadales bacterium]
MSRARLRGARLAALALAILGLAVGACVPGTQADRGPAILLATTTSTQDSGLLDVLISDFERRTGYRVKTSAVGTGAALAIGAKGDADVVLVHAPKVEREFMAAGNGSRRLLVMHNDFIFVGPPADPARVKGRTAVGALRTIATAKSPFVSRGDNSGTDILEKDLWTQAGITPVAPWYIEAATGMGQTLQIASEKRAYTITDRGTYLARRAQLELAILVDDDPPLRNYYHVIPVDPKKFPKVNAVGGNALADYLISPEAQQLIAAFGIAKYGQPLFFADAGTTDPTGP